MGNFAELHYSEYFML